MPTTQTAAARPLGRPRAFCVEAALDQASKIFRRQGYQGTSLNDLTAAMGINRPSCYAAFGDKEALFRKVLERYVHQIAALYRTACAQPTAHAVAEYLLQQTIALTQAEELDPCLLTAISIPGEPLGEVVKASRQALDRSLIRRFKRAQKTGDLPATADPAALATLLSITMRGLGDQAVERVPRAALQAQAKTLLLLFPQSMYP